MAGRHLCKPDGCVRILGLNAFRDTKLNFHRAYLDCDWGMRSVAFASSAIPLCADIPVHSFMEKLQQSYPERRNELVEMLNINLDWRMNELSDGQRRRVQILVGLIRPFKVLLLDEITTSLDVCVRQDLLKWLVKESDERGATIIYATHIFDGLDDWATHLFYLSNRGNCGWQGAPSDLDLYKKLKPSPTAHAYVCFRGEPPRFSLFPPNSQPLSPSKKFATSNGQSDKICLRSYY